MVHPVGIGAMLGENDSPRQDGANRRDPHREPRADEPGTEDSRQGSSFLSRVMSLRRIPSLLMKNSETESRSDVETPAGNAESAEIRQTWSTEQPNFSVEDARATIEMGSKSFKRVKSWIRSAGNASNKWVEGSIKMLRQFSIRSSNSNFTNQSGRSLNDFTNFGTNKQMWEQERLARRDRFNIKRALLIFNQEEQEEQFERCYCEPGLLVQPLMAYHSLWLISFCAHKMQYGVSSNTGQMALAGMYLIVPVVTFIACTSRKSAQWARKWYHHIILGNVITVMLFSTGCGIWDQLSLPPDQLCPARFYACPNHVMDANTMEITWLSLAYINVFSSCLTKYKSFGSVAIVAVFAIGAVSGNTKTTTKGAQFLAYHLFANVAVVAAGTIMLGYWGESAFRRSLYVHAQLKASSRTIADVLSKLLPSRLLQGKLQVPLLEQYAEVTVLFCTFDKAAVEHFPPETFFSELDDIYAIFDKIVEESGCFKIEHVCEDYVVVSPDVLHGHVVTKDKDRQKYAEKMCKLAKELVQVGNSHISRATGQNTGSLFGFKAGLHAGPLSSGILGRTRRFYKIFGDTVVMAARLSQNAKFSTVQISQKMNSLLGDSGFHTSSASTLHLKGKGACQAFTLIERCNLNSVTEDSSNSDSSSSHRNSVSTGYSRGQDMLSIHSSRNSRLSEVSRMRRANASNFAWTKTVDSDGIHFTQNVKIGGLFTLPNFSGREGIDIGNDSDVSTHGTNTERIVAGKANDLTATGSRNNPNLNRLYKAALSTKSRRKGSTFDYRRQTSEEIQDPVENLRNCTVDLSADRQFSVFGDYKDWKIERIYRRKTRQEILLSAFAYIRISTFLALCLFSSVAAVGQTGGWGTPSGLAGARGANIDFDDVSITTWYWIIVAVLILMIFFLPGVFAAMFRFWGAHIAMGIQSFLFGLGCVVSMICTPSALTLGLPVAFIAQTSIARIDCRVNAITAIPIVFMCIAEAFASKKLTSAMVAVSYVVILMGKLALVLRKQSWNEKLARTSWLVQDEMRKEKDTMSMMLLDMLPRKYADQIIENSGDCGGGTTHMAVILYSDLQGFTSMSERMTPYEIAMAMHGMWCIFDALVQKHGMHKMDTVGDAFIVTGLVDGDMSNLESQVCNMVDLARDMIVALQDINTLTQQECWWERVDGTINIDDLPNLSRSARSNSSLECEMQDINIRIGIDVGQIVAGVIGTLQPRFHVHGPTMLSAQKLEESCIPGTIHISDAISKMLKLKPGAEALAGYRLETPLLDFLYPEIAERQRQNLEASSPSRKKAGLVTFSEGIALATGVIKSNDVRKKRERSLKTQELNEIKYNAEQTLKGLMMQVENDSTWSVIASKRTKNVRIYVCSQNEHTFNRGLSIVFERENSSNIEECDRIPSFTSSGVENAESISKFANSFDRKSQDRSRSADPSRSVDTSRTDKSGKESLFSPRSSRDTRSPRMLKYGGDSNSLKRSLSARSSFRNSIKPPPMVVEVSKSDESSGPTAAAHDSEDVYPVSDTPPNAAVSAELVMGGIQAQEAVKLDALEVDSVPIPASGGTTFDAVGEIDQLNATVLAVESSMRDTPTIRSFEERSPVARSVAKHSSRRALNDRPLRRLSSDGSSEYYSDKGSNEIDYDC